ncbi:hypothetical protein BC827DRAFT_1274195 [Russula dissimulans]|nr:hypothetical protein BC827DRAFT_1274195 [Russula dissimulans]
MTSSPGPSSLPTSLVSTRIKVLGAMGFPPLNLWHQPPRRAQPHAPSTIGGPAYTARGATPPPAKLPDLSDPSGATARQRTLQFGKYER